MPSRIWFADGDENVAVAEDPEEVVAAVRAHGPFVELHQLPREGAGPSTRLWINAAVITVIRPLPAA